MDLAFIPGVDAYLMAAVLSAKIIAGADLDISLGSAIGFPSKSLRNIYRCSISFIASNYPIYSASIDDTTVVVWRFDVQDTGLLPSMKT